MNPNSTALSLLARIAMVASFGYYAVVMTAVWLVAVAGDADTVFSVFGIPAEGRPLRGWQIACGIAFASLALFGLARAFWAVHRFLQLRNNARSAIAAATQLVRRMSTGLFLFWLGYNLLLGMMPLILSVGISPHTAIESNYDPLDTHMIILVISIVLYSCASVFDHARKMDEENQQFV